MPGAQQREVEAKFAVAPEMLPFLQLSTLFLDGYTAQSLGTANQLDTYLETPSYDLLRHGLALRVRRRGAAFEAGIKSIQASRAGVIQDRLDIAIPLPVEANPFDASTWSHAVGEQLASYAVKLNTLRPLVVVRQQRQKAHICLATSEQPIAEWSLDEVWVEAKSDAHPATGVSSPRHFYELELEWLAPTTTIFDAEIFDIAAKDAVIDDANERERATQASRTHFDALVAQVQTRFNLTPIHTSKFVRGLDHTFSAAHDHATLVPTMELEAAGRLLLHQQLLQIMLNEHGVRSSKKAKYVHDMRVAIRRARAAIQLCATAYAADVLAPYEAGLKHLGRALGTLRDLDVARANLRTFARSQPEAQRAALKLLRRQLKAQRAAAHEALLKLLNSRKHRKFIKHFAKFCTTQQTSSVPTSKAQALLPSQLRHTLPSKLWAAFEAVRAYEVSLLNNPPPPLETFHACRIQAKYLRYLLEFARPLLGAPSVELGEQLRELQELLGELNDAHVEQTRLHQWAEAAEATSPLQAAMAARLPAIDATIDQLTQQTPARLQTLIGLPNRQILAAALATL